MFITLSSKLNCKPSKPYHMTSKNNSSSCPVALPAPLEGRAAAVRPGVAFCQTGGLDLYVVRVAFWKINRAVKSFNFPAKGLKK